MTGRARKWAEDSWEGAGGDGDVARRVDRWIRFTACAPSGPTGLHKHRPAHQGGHQGIDIVGGMHRQRTQLIFTGHQREHRPTKSVCDKSYPPHIGPYSLPSKGAHLQPTTRSMRTPGAQPPQQGCIRNPAHHLPAACAKSRASSLAALEQAPAR